MLFVPLSERHSFYCFAPKGTLSLTASKHSERPISSCNFFLLALMAQTLETQLIFQGLIMTAGEESVSGSLGIT